jgi:hypothetical protein
VHDLMVTKAVLLESLAADHGIPLVSLGSSSHPQHLRVIPSIIAATKSTSCTFAMPAEPDWELAHQVAGVILEIAAQSGKWTYRSLSWPVGAEGSPGGWGGGGTPLRCQPTLIKARAILWAEIIM